MAGKIEINRVVNANIYINGNNLMGRAEEIKLPDVEAMMSEHKGLGMIGEIELPTGFSKLEGEIKWNSFYKEAAITASNPFATAQLMCRSSLERYNSQGRVEELPLVTVLTVMFKKNPAGTFKPRENAEFQSAFSATYIKQTLGGEEILELDYMSNIFRVGGQDMLAAYRSNIGG